MHDLLQCLVYANVLYILLYMLTSQMFEMYFWNQESRKTFFFFKETGSYHIAQTGPKLLGLIDPSASASQVARMVGIQCSA
jgi:hypothetical protein